MSSFEINNGQPDPQAMVKEYRRAGADQEEPLSHELRPPEVLERTMNYLLWNVVDRVEREPGIVGEWYDFVWSRTRAIRKDITQQHLCDSTSVSLLEKCARFHIHCAQALCEEDAATFDPKINDENLNKCIQSLKDFYNDLNLKGQHCLNEPEFRAYYLLLNLTNTVVIREIKFFDKRVRDSKQIKFVLKCFFAISSNDYIKFFKLVRDTTYLNACILHRYFNNVRYSAFRVLRNACSIGQQVEFYPGSALTEQLGFTDEEELQVFCESIGIEYLDGCVVLKKSRANDNSSFNVCPVRSRQLVESKRSNQRLSEIINAAPLPPNPYRRFSLQDSFDQDGRLKRESLCGTDIPRVNFKFTQEERFSHQQDFRPPPHRRPSLREEEERNLCFYLADLVFKDVLEIFVKFSITELVIDDIAMSILGELFFETTRQVAVSIVQPMLIEEKRRVMKNRYQATMEVVADRLTRGLIGETIYRIVRHISRDLLVTRTRQMTGVQSQLMTDLLINEVTNEIINNTAKICYSEEVKKDELIKKMRTKRSHRLARNCLNLWRSKTAKAKRFRTIKATFPAGNMSQDSFKISSVILKRELQEREEINMDSKKSKNQDDAASPNDEPTSKILRPKLYAEQVACMATSPIRMANSVTNSSFDELKRRISLEKDLSDSFGRNLDAYRLSVSLSEKNGGNIT